MSWQQWMLVGSGLMVVGSVLALALCAAAARGDRMTDRVNAESHAVAEAERIVEAEWQRVAK